jgi:ketosteroid isomerase-like protein
MSQNADVVAQWVDAWNRGDLGTFFGLLDEYVMWVPPADYPEPEPRHGRDQVLEVLRGWAEPWDDYNVETIDLIERDDVVVWTARHVASKRGGPSLDAHLSFVFAFRRGRIAQARLFWEHADAVRDAGLADMPSTGRRADPTAANQLVGNAESERDHDEPQAR